MAKAKPPSSAPRPEVLAFLSDCKENPGDDTPRLVLADWLEERGDERGAFLRMQCQRVRGEDENAIRVEMPPAEADLLSRHRSDWLGYLAEKSIRTEFHRGLVKASASCRKLLSKRLAALAASEQLAWVDSLGLYDLEAKDLPALASSPHWTSLTKLNLTKSFYYADQFMDPTRIGSSSGDWEPLTALPVLPRLSDLVLNCQDLGTTGVAALASADLGHLRTLSLYANNLGDPGAIALASARSLTGLTRLELGHNRIRQEGFAALAKWNGLGSLTSLNLGGNYPGPKGMKALAASSLLRNVVHLRLHAESHPLPATYASHFFGPAGAAELARARSLKQLRFLAISGNQISAEGAESLAASKAFPALVQLDLSENAIGDEGAIALANSPLLGNLEELNLRYNGIGDRGADALARSPYVGKLKRLTYRANEKTSAEAIARLKARFGDAVCG